MHIVSFHLAEIDLLMHRLRAGLPPQPKKREEKEGKGKKGGVGRTGPMLWKRSGKEALEDETRPFFGVSAHLSHLATCQGGPMQLGGHRGKPWPAYWRAPHHEREHRRVARSTGCPHRPFPAVGGLYPNRLLAANIFHTCRIRDRLTCCRCSSLRRGCSSTAVPATARARSLETTSRA